MSRRIEPDDYQQSTYDSGVAIALKTVALVILAVSSVYGIIYGVALLSGLEPSEIELIDLNQ